VHLDRPDILDSDLGCKVVANMVKGKTPEEIKTLFNIVNDFTAEEEVRSLDPLVRATMIDRHCPIIGTDQQAERGFLPLFDNSAIFSC
jgi:hypothetical protein